LGLIDVNDRGIDGAGYDIYAIKDSTGKIIYIGETNDYARRRQEHMDSKRFRPEDAMNMERIAHVETYGDARGYEQYYMDKYHTVDTDSRGKYDADGKILAGAEANRANSYDKSRVLDSDDTRAKAFDEGYEKAKRNDSLCG
jgi:hypothetical protein